MSAEIDEAIRVCLLPRWMKVARLLAVVSQHLNAPEEQPRFDEIAARIKALIEAGKIESQGDISKWRFSEVRQASGQRSG